VWSLLRRARKWGKEESGPIRQVGRHLNTKRILYENACDCARTLTPTKPLGMKDKVIKSLKTATRRLGTKKEI
jgi:hypothetical protein